MKRAVEAAAAGAWPFDTAIDSVTLAFDDRHRRRIRLATDSGDDLLLDLPEAVALGDGDGADPDLVAHHDDTGLFVDNHLRDLIGFDAKLLDLGHQSDQIVAVVPRYGQVNGIGIFGLGSLGPEKFVDGVADAARGREIGVAQGDVQRTHGIEIEGDLALDDGAGGDAARGGHAFGHRAALALSHKTANGQGALRDGINLAIRAEQGGCQQRAAQKTVGIAQCTGADIDPRALFAESRQIGRNHYGGDVLGVDVCVPGIYAEALQHGHEALLGKG